ncbi:MAG: oligosaccharide flippase family protein [Deltaproteobacteria bacterium]|nr:oligosaccharide flippase family protein [Deltaproteobacteria bacterium]
MIIKKIRLAAPFVFCNYSQAGLSFLISMLLANILGPEEFGVYSFGLIFATGLPKIVGFGEEKTLVRDLVQCGNASAILTASMAIRIVLSIIAIIGLGVWLTIGNQQANVRWTVIFCTLGGILLGLTPRGWFDFRYEMTRHAFIILTERILFGVLLLLSFSGNLSPKGAVTVAFFLLISRMVSVSVQWSQVFKTFKVVLSRIDQFIKLLLKENYLIWGGVLGNLMMTHVNRIILNEKMGPSELAFYGLSIQIVMFVQLFQGQMLRLLTPGIAKITVSQFSPKEMREKFLKYVGLSFGLTCLIVVPLFFAGPFIIRSFMRPEFEGAIPCFYILLLWTTIYGAAIVNNQFLISLRLSKQFIAITIIFGLLSIFIALKLVPLFGAMGAALSLFISHVGSIICQFIFVWVRSGIPASKTIIELSGK